MSECRLKYKKIRITTTLLIKDIKYQVEFLALISINSHWNTMSVVARTF